MEAKQKIKHVGDRGRDGQRQLHNVMWRQVEHWETWQGVMTTFQSDISEEGCQRAATANQGFNTHRTLTHFSNSFVSWCQMSSSVEPLEDNSHFKVITLKYVTTQAHAHMCVTVFTAPCCIFIKLPWTNAMNYPHNTTWNKWKVFLKKANKVFF